MPPPQCPECGRFLATAFVEQITTTAAPCPGCGIDLFLGEEDEDAGDAGTTPATPTTPAVPPPGAILPDDVEPEPETSVRPPDLAGDRDPLQGWDQTRTVTAGAGQPDPVVLAAGAGIGLLLGLLLGGPERRGLGGLVGAVLGAVAARLRG